MAKTDTSVDHIKFLVSCISHSNNGRPDFQAVADELDIVSKAAAQKRYERMLKAHNVTKSPTKNAAGEGEEASPKTPKTPKTTPKKRQSSGPGSATKKRATKGGVKKEESDDEDTKPPRTPLPSDKNTPVKKEPKKEEDSDNYLSEPPKSESDAASAPTTP